MNGAPRSLKTIALWAMALAGVWTVSCLGIAWWRGLPEPAVHDEFAYLLGADTFAHGRLTNAPHPLRRFFQEPHVLMTPTRESKYPPGQSLALAMGQALFGHPYFGVVISGAAMVFLFAMTFSARVSLRAGMAVAGVFGVLFLPPMYWVYSYWGGCVAAAGGAAVLLAAEVYRRGHGAAAGVTFAAGVMTLFLTRPYEGAVFTLAAVAADAWLLYGERGKEAGRGAGWFLAASVPIVAAGLAWSAYYNYAVTGNALLMPHVVYDRQFMALPNFWFFAPLNAQVSDARMAALQGIGSREFNIYAHLHSSGFFAALKATGKSLEQLFGWTLLLLFPAALAWSDFRVRAMVCASAVSVFGMSLTTMHFGHYAAPLVGGVGVLFALGVEDAWLRQGGGRAGRLFSGGAVAMAAVGCLAGVFRSPVESAGTTTFRDARAAVVRNLVETGEDQVVVVRYPVLGFQVDAEWVHNSADIDSQQVVFAHDLGDRENAALRRYYPQRKMWLMALRDQTFSLAPYEPAP